MMNTIFRSSRSGVLNSAHDFSCCIVSRNHELVMGAESLPMPLLRIAGDASKMRTANVELTPFGLDVLEGRASNFPANPIEEWAAGVQLSSSRGNSWFRDGQTLKSHVHEGL